MASRSICCSFYSCNAAHLLQLLRWRRGPLATAKFRGSNTEHLLQLLRWRRGPPAAVTSPSGETLTHPHHPTLLPSRRRATLTHPHHPTLLPSRRRAMLPPKEVLAYKANSSLAIIVHHLRIFHCHTMPQLALSLQLILFAACIILACFIRTLRFISTHGHTISAITY